MRRIVQKRIGRRALPLALAALFFLGACDDEEKKPEVEVHLPKGVELKVKRSGDDETSEMIILGELALFTAVIVWALFGPGASRLRDEATSEHR